MNYIIVDLEMNPIAGEYKAERQICRFEIIEIGAVLDALKPKKISNTLGDMSDFGALMAQLA